MVHQFKVGKELTNQDEILHSLANPSWDRLFHVSDAIKLGIPFKTIYEKTKIDHWFLRQIEGSVKLERRIEEFTVDTIPKELMRGGGSDNFENCLRNLCSSYITINSTKFDFRKKKCAIFQTRTRCHPLPPLSEK